MPETNVVFFSEEKGSAPAFEALEAMLRQGKRKALAKCLVRIARLAEKGHELRRPEADLLRDGIHELRATHRRQHYRILYFFHGADAILSHLVVKERSIPDQEIDRAKMNKEKFAADPGNHTFRGRGWR